MSSSVITQLKAIGEQDKKFLSRDPKDSIFQEPEKKITNFSRSKISMIPMGNADFGNTVKFKIKKEGDLLSSMYLHVELPKLDSLKIGDREDEPWASWNDYIGNVLIENIKLYIGGQLIDEQTGEFMQIYTDLYDAEWNRMCLTGLDPDLITPAETINSTHVYVPLKFWFCNSLNKSLPLIALQYHDVEIEVKIRDWDSCYHVLKKETSGGGGYVHYQESNKMSEQSLEGVRLDCNYIYLDTEERKRFAQSNHKYMITQTQTLKCGVSQGKTVDLNFNHPVKDIFYYFQNNTIKNLPEPFNFSFKSEYPSKNVFDKYITTDTNTFTDYNNSSKKHFLDEARILINGHQRVEWKDYKYYYYLQNYENYRTKCEHYAYMYAFSSQPKVGVPMGSLNFSRVDNAQLQFSLNEDSKTHNKIYLAADKQNVLDDNNHTIVVHAINYNYLIISNGMAGLAYKN